MSDSLIGAMGTPPRRLPNLRPPAPAPAPAPEPEPAATDPEPEPEPAPTRERPRSRATRSAGGRPPTGRQSKGFGLPVPLVPRVEAAARAARQPYGDYLMAALNRVWDRLPEVYPPLPKVRPELPPPRRPPRRSVPGGRQAVNFRLDEAQTEAIADRQKALLVESRSEFVTTIIELDLGVADADGED